MAYTYFPMVASTTFASASDYQLFDAISEISEAIRERAAYAKGDLTWPGGSDVKASFTITSAVDNGDGSVTLTDSSLASIPGGDPDDGLYWNGQKRSGCGGSQYWSGVLCPLAPWIPSEYAVMIDYSPDGLLYNKPWNPIEANINFNRNKSLNIEAKELNNHIFANFLSSIPAIVGAKVYITKRHPNWWGHRKNDQGRWLDYPNYGELWRGRTLAGSSLESSTTGLLIEKYKYWNHRKIKWKIDKFKDAEVLIFDENNDLQRLTIFGNSKDGKIYFGNKTTTGGTFHTFVDRPYIIVKAGGKGFPDRENGVLRWDYGGFKQQVYVHYDPSDAVIVSDRDIAAAEVEYHFSNDPLLDCGDDETKVVEPALDVDNYVPTENYCTPRDFYFANDAHKTIRSWQVWIEHLCTQYVVPISYDNAKSIPDGTVPRFFKYVGINSGQTTFSTATAGVVHFNTDILYKNVGIEFTVLDDNGDNLETASVQADDNGVVFFSNATYSGRDVIWTAKWTENEPLEFLFLYQSDAFVPDIYSDDDGTVHVVDPPLIHNFCCDVVGEPPHGPSDCCHDCNGAGTWYKRGRNTCIKSYNDSGYRIIDTHFNFKNGDILRYSGTGWSDGLLTGSGQDSASTQSNVYQNPDTESHLALKDYWDHLDERQFRPNAQRRIRAERRGKVTAADQNGGTNATLKSITDKTKNWWDYWYRSGAPLGNKIHTGIIKTGGTDTVILDELVRDPTNPLSCWWKTERFQLGYGQPFVSFILEIDRSETVQKRFPSGNLMLNDDGTPMTDTATVTYKFPIVAAINEGASRIKLTITAIAGFTIADGESWRIREPKYNLNRYQDRMIKMWYPDGTIVTRELVYSDNSTLFWLTALPSVPPVGTRYKIIEFYPGAVFRYSTTAPADDDLYQKVGINKWMILVNKGTDTPRGQTFHRNSRENEPHHRTKYGRITKGCFVTDSVLNEMYTVLNAIWQQKHTSILYDSRANVAVSENNVRSRSDEVTAFYQAGDYPGPFTGYQQAAWDQIMAELAGGIVGFNSTGEERGVPPQAVADTSEEDGGRGCFGANDYSVGAVQTNKYAYAYISGIHILLPHSYDLYLYTEINSLHEDESDTHVVTTIDETGNINPSCRYTYDVCNGLKKSFQSMGTGFVYRRFHKIQSFAEATIDKHISNKIGEVPSTSLPEAPPCLNFQHADPEETGQSSSETRGGFYVSNQIGIIKWKFKYIA